MKDTLIFFLMCAAVWTPFMISMHFFGKAHRRRMKILREYINKKEKA